MGIRVIDDKCTGCKVCIAACPFGAIEVKVKKAIIDDKCTLCGACVEVCKFEAIVIEKEKTSGEDLSKYTDVWVFAEQRDNIISSVAYELLGEGRKLADATGENLCAVLIGDGIKEKAQDLISHGADKVYLADAPLLKYFQDDPYTQVFVDLIKEWFPSIVLMGATAVGRSLAPRVAARLKTGLTADCTGLEIDKERGILLQTRPAFGGNIMATIICPGTRPQMATVRHKVMKKAKKDGEHKGEIIVYKIDNKKLISRTKLIDFVEEVTKTVNLAEADIIVSGGRGLGEAKNFKLIEELAQAIGGAVGASRAAVDAGWIPYSHQVGQTGRTVCPKIYIACGISGAIQHLIGMQSSDIIIAINKDPLASIFKIATYGIEGDLFEIVPLLTKKFKEVLG